MDIGLPSRALSVRQPWAWAIIHGGKDIENRTAGAVKHFPMVEGRICVHASMGMSRLEYEDAREFMLELGVECPHPKDLVRGGIIGSVELQGVVKQSSSQWFFGPRGLRLSNPEPIGAAIPVAGSLGLFWWRQARIEELSEVKPWMQAWPEKASRVQKQAEFPLLDI